MPHAIPYGEKEEIRYRRRISLGIHNARYNGGLYLSYLGSSGRLCGGQDQ
jgi:hypothetical protein